MDDDHEDSVTTLITRLCKLHIKDNRRAFLVQPKSSKKIVQKKLERTAYDALFGYLFGPLRPDRDKDYKSDDEIIKIFEFVYTLRRSRRFDDADRLEELLDELVDINGQSGRREKQDGTTSILRLLVLLIESGPKKDEPLLGYKERKSPITPDQEKLAVLPAGPLWYGDTHRLPYGNQFYMHYSRELFENVRPLELETGTNEIFKMTPGCGLDGNGLFNVTGYLKDAHEKETKETLFGALVQSRVTSLDIKLDLPDLPDETDMKLYECRIPKALSKSSQLSEDAGFLETQLTESTSTVCTQADSAIEVDLLSDDLLSVVPSKHYTWETRGLPGSTGKPYITEAGDKAFDELYRVTQKAAAILCPDISTQLRQVSQAELVQDTINLMLAIPSTTFQLSKDIGTFELTEGTHISGMTPEMVQHAVEDFMECGGNYYRLEQFALPPEVSSFYSAGLIFHAFTGAVRKVLHHYRATVLSIPSDTTLLRLKFICHKLFSQIQFLTDLCKCRVGDESEHLTGIKLISYLYRETLESASTDNYPMMLSVLQATCAPYIMFVQDWVFHGIHRDIYGEFLVDVHEDFLQFRDKNYWTNGYTLTTAEKSDSVPLFLTHLAEDIFICGKSLNLLKACCPQHFLCNVSDHDIPRISITFSEYELKSLDTNCEIYVSKMQQIARQIAISRKEMQARAEAAKRYLLQKAKQEATKAIEKIEEKIMQKKKQEDEKKRQQFKFLKQQMEDDLERRASKKEAEKKEDKDYIAKVTRQEEAMDEKELELERRAREEMIEYYSKLTEGATFREQKALWRVRRSQLRLARLQFIQDDENLWKSEMEKLEDIQKNKDGLPSWVQKSEGREEPVVVDGQEGEELPKWAQKRLTSPVPETFSEDKTSDIQMPNWARKFLLSSDGSADNVQTSDESPDELSPAVNKQENSALLNSVFESSDNVDLDLNIKDSVPAGRPSLGVIKRPETPNIKTGLKLSDKMSATAQSEESSWKPGIQVKQDAPAYTETKSFIEDKPQIKILEDKHVSLETTESDINKPVIKSVQNIHVSKETESSDSLVKPHIKPNLDMHASKQSTGSEETSFPKLKRSSDMDSMKESEPSEWKIKKASLFGHVSQLSNLEFTISAPRLKRPEKLFALEESDLRDFSIRPKIRVSKTRHANVMSEPEQHKPHIKMSDVRSATMESEYVDTDEIRRLKFLQRNLYGHASDSTVQKLLYGGRANLSVNEDTEEQEGIQKGDAGKIKYWSDIDEVEPYQDDFKFLSDEPMTDLLATRMYVPYGSLGDYGISQSSDVDLYRYMSLPALLKHSVTAPLMSQISLVNESVINYMTSEVQIDQHFLALHRYLFMADGDFAQILSDILFEKLASSPKPQELLNPVFLNGALTKALQLSMCTEDKHADNLSFALKFVPKVLQQNAHDTLDCLELVYQVKWPINIVITDSCIDKYSKVFSFMLQLKRIVWVLKDVWHRLKRDALVHKVGSSSQFRQLQLYRQEMQHFVKVMQGYITNQIIHVAWQELQDALANDVKNLDDLHRVHAEYLNKTIFRCLLNKKAAPLMKIIKDIFCLILKFRTQLINSTWCQNDDTREITNSGFNHLFTSYKAFREYSVFLFKVVNKLAIRGYQPHLQELLLRLNFNDYYKVT